MVKIITMVKNEVDIVSDWILYHGYLFGFQNIFVIDNYSNDGTYEELLKFKDLINVSRETTYTKKGEYMRSYINKYCDEGEIAFPIDIDEFIVYFNYNTNKISIDKNIISTYINNLPPHYVYKMNYIWSKFTCNDIITHPNGFIHAPVESKYGYLAEFNIFSKGFINTKLNHDYIDMGNHFLTNNHYKTDLCLIHFHCRNLDQMKNKILNNILGLGYKNELTFLETLTKNNNTKGIHHVHNQIAVLKNEYVFNPSSNDNSDIDLTIFNNQINKINMIEIKNIPINNKKQQKNINKRLMLSNKIKYNNNKSLDTSSNKSVDKSLDTPIYHNKQITPLIKRIIISKHNK